MECRIDIKRWLAVWGAMTICACGSTPGSGGPAEAGPVAASSPAAATATVDPMAIDVVAIATFDEPWAMTFLPDGRLLVTEKPGRLQLVTQAGEQRAITNLPAVDYGGQGGLGDVILHPDFSANRMIYLSYAEAGPRDKRGAAVARATLDLERVALGSVEVIWRQVPKVTGRGHYGHRLAFAPDGHLFISSGERQKFTPAQDRNQNLGKILRLNADGSVPADNPFAAQGGVAAQVWSLGHRNPLGIAFDARGRLWNHEMGPRGGDELNLVERGNNYGYPVVSNGNHYDGRRIPDHSTRPEFAAPKVSWTPVISPAGLIFYNGERFPHWRGDALAGGLSAQALIEIEFDGDEAREAGRYNMGRRIREVEQGPGGFVWLLEDGNRGRLLKLVPNPG